LEADEVYRSWSEKVATHRTAGHRIGKEQIQQPYERETGAMKDRVKRTRGSGNVFLDLGFDKAEAENLKLRSELMMRIEDFYRQSGMTQAAAAKALGITQPRLNALLKGRIGLFSLDALVNIASRAGLDVRLVIRKAA
jgi:predicted XRE-type DNA-binding protein